MRGGNGLKMEGKGSGEIGMGAGRKEDRELRMSHIRVLPPQLGGGLEGGDFRLAGGISQTTVKLLFVLTY